MRYNALTTRGVTMLELIIYIGLLVLLMAAVVAALVRVGGGYRSLRANESIETATRTALERMVREVHDADSIDLSGSTFGASPGALLLNTTTADGATTTVRFLVASQQVRIEEGGVDRGPLTGTDVRVTNLTFRRLSSGRSEGVKIELTLESGTSTSYRSENFYVTAILRGSYPLQ